MDGPNNGVEMTTSDGQGLNWKWITGLAISIIAGLLVLVGTLINNIATDKNTQLCGIQETLKNVKDAVGEVKITVTKLESNQTWTMAEMVRVREELKNHEDVTKKANR